MSDALVRSYRLVLRVVLLQAGCAVLVALMFLVFKGASAGLAALVGGLIVAVASAGLFNAIAISTTRSNFVRWGYPAWWCRVTGALEISTAILVAIPATRAAGLVLCAVILAAAALTILRHREFSHLAPIGCFAALLLMASRIF